MATIIIGSYMMRYPLGGNLSWGHDIYFVEKSAYPNSCYNPIEQDVFAKTSRCTLGSSGFWFRRTNRTHVAAKWLANKQCTASITYD